MAAFFLLRSAGIFLTLAVWERRIFWASLGIIFYTWLGYPLLLGMLTAFRPKRRAGGSGWPTFSIIVAAYNEEAQIAAKLEDCVGLRYPREAMEIIVASDGSTDSTEAIVAQWMAADGRIRLLKTEGRAGKSGAQNLAVSCAGGEMLLFTDAGTRSSPELLERIAPHFADPRVGAVAPVVEFGKRDSSVNRGQGAYWRYELFLRQRECELGILATLSGAAFAVRRTLYRPIPAQFGDDCIVPLDVRLQGHTVVQDADAVVYDEMPHTPEAELRMRVRMTARNWSGILARPRILNPLLFPGTAWGLLSHKLLRWLTPFFLAAALLTNVMLGFGAGIFSFWTLSFFMQSAFYSAAGVGWKRSGQESSHRILGYPFAFCLANAGFLLGIWRSARGRTIIAYR